MQEIDLYDLMRFYVKNWRNLLGALFLGALIGFIYTSVIQTPLYKSEASLTVAEPADGIKKPTSVHINKNYAELFKSRLVLENVVQGKNYAGGYNQLLAHTTASADSTTDFLHLSIADTTPETSQALLNAAIASFQKEAVTIYASAEDIKVVDTASLPKTAYNVRTTMQIALGAAATFIAAVIALFFVYDYKNSTSKHTVATKAAKARTAKKPTPKQKKSAKA